MGRWRQRAWQLPALDSDLPKTFFRDAVITGQQRAAGLLLSEPLQFVREEADEWSEQRVGALEHFRIRMVHEGMARFGIARENGEILFTQ